MQSSFKKINLPSSDLLPLRQVYNGGAIRPGTRNYNENAMAVLTGLASRLDNMQSQLKDLYSQQLKAGWLKGYQEGYAEAIQQAAGLVQAAAAEHFQAAKNRAAAAEEFKEQVVDLVAAICGKLLDSELAKRETAVKLIEEALTHLQTPLDAVVFCHPDKIPEFQSASFNRLARGTVEIIGDPTLPIHAMRIEGQYSVIEVDLLKELQQIAGELKLELAD